MMNFLLTLSLGAFIGGAIGGFVGIWVGAIVTVKKLRDLGLQEVKNRGIVE